MGRAIRVGAVWLVLGSAGLLACASDPPKQTDAASVTPMAGASGPASGSGPSSAAGTSGGATANANCALQPLPANLDDVIATFEEGTGGVSHVAGRGGGFYMYNDGTGTQTPPTGAAPNATAVSRCGSTFAMCMSGKNFTTWGAGMGTDLAEPAAGMIKQTYDASAYKGVAFWAKTNVGSGVTVRVSLKDKNTAPEGGQCDMTATSGAQACNDDWGKGVSLTADWQPYTVSFLELKQGGWGKAFNSFNAAAVYSVQFQVSQGVDFDLCIDDLVFTH